MKRIAILTILVVVGITAWFLISISALRFDYDFEKFFPESDPDTEFFNEYRKKFETDNDFVLVGIANNKGVFNREFLIKIDSLTQQLSKVNNITEAISITNYEEVIRSDFSGGIFVKKMVHLETDSMMSMDSSRIMHSDLIRNTLVSDKGNSVAIYLKTTPYLSKAASDSLAHDLNEILDQASFDEIHIAGRSTGQSYYVKLMQSELLLFIISSFVLVVIFLSLSFRTLWGVAIPILVVIFSVIWIIGLMANLGVGINLVQTVMPTILFVVGMSDSVHVITKYIEELRAGNEKMQALKKSFGEVAIATFLTSFTTAIGFITLTFIPIEPVRTFGIFTSIGILFAYLLSFTLLPAVLILMPAPKIALRTKNEHFWNRRLSGLFLFLIRNKIKITISVLLLFSVSVYSAFQLDYNNYLLEDLKDSDPMKKNFTYFADNFSGARPFELGVTVKDENKNAFDYDVLQSLDSIEKFLVVNYGVGNIVSPLTIIKTANKSYHTGSDDYYRIPDSPKELAKLVKRIRKYDTKNAMKTVLTEDLKSIRISGKMADIGSKSMREKNILFYDFMKQNNFENRYDYQLTGTAFLIDKNNIYLATNLVYGLMISVLIISLITAFLFNFSFKMVFVALFPNILPILMIASVMAVFGIYLKVSTSMIFAISFGIAVDDTIHFLSRLKIELSKGRSLMYALKRTYLSTGKAIIITTIILSGGFLTLTFSNFIGTFNIGLLIGLTLIFALLSDLFYLPILLWWLKPVKKKKERN